MFKRRGPPPPQQEQKKQIGQPQLLHTTYDQNNLLAPKSAGGLTASNAPSEYFKRPTQDISSSLYGYRRFDSSLDTGDVFKPGHHRDVSSVYSRPSHDGPHESDEPMPSQSSIPAMAATLTQPYSEPVMTSPDTSDVPTPVQSNVQEKKNYFSSNIPQSRKPKPTEGTLWDKYRGEPVQDPQRGKPGSVKPNTFEKNMRNDERYQVTISGGNEQQQEKPKKATWGERAARIRKDTFDARPPWRGGSGRAAIVDPVKDTTVPRSSPKFTAVRDASRNTMEESGSDNSLGARSAKADGERDMSPVSQLGGRYDEEYHIARNDSTVDAKDVSPIATNAKSYFTPQPQQQQRREPSARGASQGAPSSTPSRVSRKPVGTRALDKESRSPLQSGSSHEWSGMSGSTRPTQGELQGDPVSRFSWTTVNTTTTYQQDSPPPSPPSVPVPTLDRQAWRNVNKGPSVPEKPPTPPPHGDEKRRPKKDLPPAPLASKNMSHVEILTTQEDDLSLRRRNIQKIITELQQIDSASPLDVDWKTVKANKLKLVERQTQLAEIEREQHELGLAIARARRKAEREDGIESGLWVRKVTG